MKRLVTATALLLAASICMSDTASAQQPGGYGGLGGFGGFLPYGFYQPYGARYSNSVPNPPYFALNPPVYYGSRYSRPYGMSPFAAPPQVSAPAGYRGSLDTQFHQPARPAATNPYLCNTKTAETAKVAMGEVRENPFATDNNLVAKN